MVNHIRVQSSHRSIVSYTVVHVQNRNTYNSCLLSAILGEDSTFNMIVKLSAGKMFQNIPPVFHYSLVYSKSTLRLASYCSRTLTDETKQVNHSPCILLALFMTTKWLNTSHYFIVRIKYSCLWEILISTKHCIKQIQVDNIHLSSFYISIHAI